MHFNQSAHRFLEGIHARLEPLEQQNTNQSAQRVSGAMQTRVWLALLFGRVNVVIQSIPRIRQFITRCLDDAALLWFSEVAAQLLVKPLIRVLDTVFNRLQFAFREKLMSPADDDIRALPAVEIIAELRRVNLLVRLRIEAIPAQDVVARAANEDVRQQVRQFPLSLL